LNGIFYSSVPGNIGLVKMFLVEFFVW